jgi:serine/threonine protein kinase
MTPEQLEGAPATFASDVYAFGVVSYLMLAGRHPRHPGYNEAAQRTRNDQTLFPGSIYSGSASSSGA